MTVALGIGVFAPQPLLADPGDDDYALAVKLYNGSRWNTASEAFRKFLKEAPKHPQVPSARMLLGEALTRQEKYTEARTVLRGYVGDYAKAKDLADAMYRVAECSYFLDDFKSAEKEFQAFLKKDPKHKLAEYALPYLGDAQLRLKNPQAASVSFSKALKTYPKSDLAEDAKYGLARAYESLKKSREAITLYAELAADEKGTKALFAQESLATLYYDGGQFAKSAEAYVDLATRFPKSDRVSQSRLNAGFAWYRAGEFRKAIGQFDLASKDKRLTISGNYGKGVAYKSLREFEPAAAALKSAYEASAKNQGTEDILFHWADTQMQLTKYASARKLFLEFNTKWPKHASAANALLLATESALLNGNLDEASTSLARFDKDYPGTSLSLRRELLKGRLLETRAGRANTRQAVVHFRKVIDDARTPGIASQARFYLARSLQSLEDDKQVITVVEPLLKDVRRDGAKSDFIGALALAGSSYLKLKNYKQASAVSSEYLKLLPQGGQAANAFATRAVAEAQQRNKAQAQSDLTALRSRDAKGPLLLPTTFQIAEIAYDRKDWTWSEELYTAVEKAGKQSSLHTAALSGKAWSQFEQKKYPAAAKSFGQVVKDHPNDRLLAVESAYKQAESLQEANDTQAATAAYAETFRRYAPVGKSKPLAEQQPPLRYAFLAGLQSARMLRTQKKVDASDAAYEAVFEKFPKPKGLDVLLDEWALLNYEAKRYDRADELFQRLIKEAPNSDRAYAARLNLAESDLIAGRTKQAQESFEELVASSRSTSATKERSLLHLVGIHVDKADWKQVAALCEQVQQQFPKSDRTADAQFHLGESKFHLNDFPASLKSLAGLRKQSTAAAIRKAEWFPQLWVILAEISIRQKKYTEVSAVVDEYRTLDPKSPHLYKLDEILGRSYKNQTKWKEAQAAYRRVTESPTGRRTLTAAKAQLYLAETYLEQKNYKTARGEYLKVYYLYKHPEFQAPALYQAALIDQSLKNRKDAINAYEDLIKDFPTSKYARMAKTRLAAAKKQAGT
jgi:TolA-binding protein